MPPERRFLGFDGFKHAIDSLDKGDVVLLATPPAFRPIHFEYAVGMGGRQVRQEADQLFDHYAAEYTFPDGTRMHAQARHMAGCHDFFGDVIHGTKGSGVMGEGITKPRLFHGHKPTRAQVAWDYQGSPCDHYQNEHDLFFDAIRHDRPYNEVERSAKSCLTAIMGRMAVESGKWFTWEDALHSGVELAPGLEEIQSLQSSAPVQPNPSGRYPIAMRGYTQVL